MARISELYRIAAGEIGTTEVEGTEANPRVLEYYRHAGAGYVADDAVPWCAAFLGWVLAQAGIKNTGSLLARSYLDWGREAKKPGKGCVVVLKRGTQPWQGHVGFLDKIEDKSVWVLGGNQGDAVNVKKFPRSAVLGFREPGEAETAPVSDLSPETPVDTRHRIWLMEGTIGPKVKQAQMMLIALGHDAGPADGIFGPLTAKAVREFKRSIGFKDRALIERKTWDALTARAAGKG